MIHPNESSRRDARSDGPSQATDDRFTAALGALIAGVYLKLKHDFPDFFTIRDLKRATEAVTLFLEAGLSEKDAFVEACHYGFTRIRPDNEPIIRSIVEEQQNIKAVLTDFEPLDLTSQAPQLPMLVTSLSEGVSSFVGILITFTASPRTKAVLSLLSALVSAPDKRTQIVGRKIAYDVLVVDFLRDIIVEELEGELTDTAWTARQAAVAVLVSVYDERIRDGKAVDTSLLELMLRDESWAVRQATAEALGTIYPALIQRGTDVDLNALEVALSDRSWVVRKTTANALGTVYAALIEHGNAVEMASLQRLLTDHDTEVRQATVRALGVAYPELVKRGDSVDIDALEADLGDRDEKFQMALIDTLGRVYVSLLDQGVAPSLSKLEHALDSEFLGVRKMAAQVLSAVYPAFIKHDRQINVAQIERGLDGLIDYIRQTTIEALGIIYPALIEAGVAVDVSRLKTGLTDEYWAVRQATAEALGTIYPALIQRGTDVDLNALEAALSDRSWVVRKTTANALGTAYAALIEHGNAVDSALLERLLSQSDDQMRRTAVNALSRVYLALIEHGNVVNVAPLEQLLTDHDPEVRRATIEALGAIYPALIQREPAVEVKKLEKSMHSKHAGVRVAAAEALGTAYAALIEHGNVVNVAPLEQLLTDHDPEVRRATIEALRRVYPRQVSEGGAAPLREFERALDDEAAEVRAAAQDLFASVARAVLSGQEEAGFAEAIRELDKELNEPLSAPLSGAYSPFVLLEKDSLQVGRLTLKKKRLRTSTPPCIVTKASYEMLYAIASAYLLHHPLLLMGPTSTGKSFLVKWLAEALGNQHVSYTLNPYISKSELIGGIKPDRRGTFVWQDGIILKAAKRGMCLVLEELNLATSEVLEILNDYLITGKFVYSENGDQRVVEPSNEFRLFATANPLSYAQRERLSRVFVSRFKVHYQPELSEEDLIEILSGLFDIPAHLAYSVAFFHITLQEQADSKVIGKEEKEQYIFSLRDLIRLGRRLTPAIKANVPEPALLQLLARELSAVYVARVRNGDEREALIKLIDTLFGLKTESTSIEDVLAIRAEQLEQCLTDLSVTRGRYLIPGQEAHIVPTKTQRQTLASVVRALFFNEPILLVGYPASGKTTLIRYLAREKKADLYYVNLSSDSGLEELLGGYTQGRSGKWHYKRGLLFKAVKKGAWLLIDEANLNPLSEYLNTLLDFGYVADEEGTLFELHPNFRLFFSINPPKIHPSRNVLSPALRTRFNEIWIEEITDAEELSELVESWKHAQSPM
ncbi:MAG: HEAT repeat domain-containing protein [Halobacteriota archaeon]